jgi:hypothetical protein
VAASNLDLRNDNGCRIRSTIPLRSETSTLVFG